MLDTIVDGAKWIWASRTYQPSWMPLYLSGVSILAVALTVLPVVVHRFSKSGQENHQAWLLGQSMKSQLKVLESEKYQNKGPLLRSVEEHQSEPSPPPLVFTKEREQAEDGTERQELALLYPDDAEVTRLYYVVLAGHSVWERGSSVAVEAGQKTMQIEDALRRDFVKKLVDESSKIICIGVASSEPSPDNTRLADDRAINLCHALFNIDYARSGAHTAYGISIGEAVESVSGASVSLQRSVIIVGIGNSNRAPWPIDIIEAVTQQARIPGVKIDQYRRSDGRRYKVYALIGAGELNGVVGKSWEQLKLEPGTNPLDAK